MGPQVVIIAGTVVLIVTGLLLGYVISQLVLQNLPFNPVTLLGTISLILIFWCALLRLILAITERTPENSYSYHTQATRRRIY